MRSDPLFRMAAAVLVLALAAGPSGAYAQESGKLSLAGAVQTAQAGNPKILAARKRWEAARARVPQARSPEDPKVSAGAWMLPKNPFNVKKGPEDERMLTVSQFIPFFGKLPLQGKIAAVEAQMAGAEYKQTELDVVNEVKKAYFDLFMNYKEEELSRQSLVFLRGLARTAEARYASGSDMPQAEVLKIDVEIARLETSIINLQQERKAREAALNNLLGKGPEETVGEPAEPAQTLPGARLDALYKSTLTNQPELLSFRYAIEKNKFEKSLAKRSVFPDIMADITKRGMGLWDIMLSFTVPLWYWTKQRYQIKEAVANLEEAEAAYKAMSNQALAETKAMYVRTQTAYNRMELYKKNLLPLLRQSIASSLSAFSSGNGDFMALLDSERMLIDTQMEYYKALVELNMSMADLERAAGTGLAEVRL